MKALALLQQKKITEAQAYDMLLAFALDCFDYIDAPRQLVNARAALHVGLAFEFDADRIPSFEIYHQDQETEPDFEPRCVYVLLLYLSGVPQAKAFTKEIKDIEGYTEELLADENGMITYYS